MDIMNTLITDSDIPQARFLLHNFEAYLFFVNKGRIEIVFKLCCSEYQSRGII